MLSMYHAMLQIRPDDSFLPWPCSFLPFPPPPTCKTAKPHRGRGNASRSVNPSAHRTIYPSSSSYSLLHIRSSAGAAFLCDREPASRIRYGAFWSPECWRCGAVINWPGRLLKFGVLASRFQSPERDRGGGDMRLLRIVGKSASSHTKAAAAADPLPDAKDDPDGAGAVTVVAAGADRNNGSVNGSKDELFFEARPWLDSDSEDDFYSVRGDFTPSRGSTPDHPRLTPSSGRILVDRSGPSLVQKKQRLIELLQEKQHYDDEDDSVTDVSSDLEHSAVHAEEHMKASRKTEKSKKSSRSGCFPTLVWKRSFTSCRKKKKEKEQKDKVN